MLAILTDLLATQAAGGRTWDIHVGHIAERHALFVIIALGESLIVAGTAVAAHERTVALAADTVESYDHFIGRHPDSELAAQARARVAQLNEDRDWQQATATRRD